MVPDPLEGDIHQHSFVGWVSGFHDTYVTVGDTEDEYFDIEPERLRFA